MSYRSKKTFVATSGNGNASQNKQPTFVVDSSLETSKATKHSSPESSQPPKPSSVTSQPPKPPFNPSSSKWGPFNPPTPQAFDSEDFNEVQNRDRSVEKGKSSKPRPRNRIVVPNWPDNVNFDEKSKTIAYDANGNRHLVKGSVQPQDIWIDNELRYMVKFDAYNQPLGKGGSILVSFLGDVVKREAFCPVGYATWHKLNPKMRVDIVIVVRLSNTPSSERICRRFEML